MNRIWTPDLLMYFADFLIDEPNFETPVIGIDPEGRVQAEGPFSAKVCWSLTSGKMASFDSWLSLSPLDPGKNE